jgi:hypothetical protein
MDVRPVFVAIVAHSSTFWFVIVFRAVAVCVIVADASVWFIDVCAVSADSDDAVWWNPRPTSTAAVPALFDTDDTFPDHQIHHGIPVTATAVIAFETPRTAGVVATGVPGALISSCHVIVDAVVVAIYDPAAKILIRVPGASTPAGISGGGFGEISVSVAVTNVEVTSDAAFRSDDGADHWVTGIDAYSLQTKSTSTGVEVATVAAANR